MTIMETFKLISNSNVHFAEKTMFGSVFDGFRIWCSARNARGVSRIQVRNRWFQLRREIQPLREIHPRHIQIQLLIHIRKHAPKRRIVEQLIWEMHENRRLLLLSSVACSPGNWFVRYCGNSQHGSCAGSCVGVAIVVGIAVIRNRCAEFVDYC